MVGIIVSGAYLAVRVLIRPGHVGVNYFSLYNEYDTPDSRLAHDFTIFQKNGINTIALPLYWYRIELSPGVYDQEFINNVARVVKIASTYGLSVLIEFHTLIGVVDLWSNPAYVGVGMNLVLQPNIATAYVAMVKWTVNQLKGLPNIWAYSVLNEPWYWPLGSSRESAWISLIGQLSQAVKSIDPRPVTVNFVGAIFDEDWTWNSKLLNSLDFISINAYLDDNSTGSTYWSTWGEYEAGLNNIARNASAYGKAVQITEYGYATPDDAVQQAVYNEYVSIFKSTPNLIGWLSWGWDSSYDPNNPAWTAIGNYAIDIQSTGTPRPAYSAICQAEC